MSENIISWTPCKIKKPPKKGFYFVTIKNPVTDVVVVRSFPHEDWMRSDFIAWAELPEKYDKRKTKNVKFNWHPYPEEIPEEFGNYILTVKNKKKRIIATSHWFNNTHDFCNGDDEQVLAWAKFPEPYKESI